MSKTQCKNLRIACFSLWLVNKSNENTVRVGTYLCMYICLWKIKSTKPKIYTKNYIISKYAKNPKTNWLIYIERQNLTKEKTNWSKSQVQNIQGKL